MSEKLKPCPFCGGKFIDPDGYWNEYGHGPRCEECGAIAESNDAWNRRVEPSVTDDLMEVIRHAYYKACVLSNSDQIIDVIAEAVAPMMQRAGPSAAENRRAAFEEAAKIADDYPAFLRLMLKSTTSGCQAAREIADKIRAAATAPEQKAGQ